MRDTLSHRGPDDAGIYLSGDKRVGLAHRRLSIIDLSQAGHQPMSDPDESLWIIFNGEIYNFQDIKKDLVQKGYRFRSNSDTEVIIHAYQEYGTACLELFNGMFAFAIFDQKNKILFIARDRFGIKPLYYSILGDGTFACASELKALVEHPGFQKSISISALGDYFKYRYIPSPHTIWKGIYKLPHSHYCIFDIEKRGFSVHRYYSLIEKIQGRRKATIEDVETSLYEAVKRRLISDVEVGTLLSGGIDSSTISLIAKGYSQSIKSFSIGFTPEEYSELAYSKMAADHIKTRHITEIVENFDDQLMEDLSYHFDEPLADSSCIPTFILCRMVEKHVKVALSGDGGDEVFAGYSWYQTYWNDFLRLNGRPVFKIISLIRNMFGTRQRYIPDFESYYNRLLLNRFDQDKLKRFLAPEVYTLFKQEDMRLFDPYLNSPFENVRLVQYIDMNTFMIDDILTKVDRASMAHSLEVRVPLLDHQLVENVFLLDERDFPTTSTGKPVLKRIVRDKLPEEILTRTKKGFSAPVATWIGFQDIKKTIRYGKTIKDGLFQEKFVKELLEDTLPNSQGMLWMLFIFEKWYQRWIDGGMSC